MASICMSQKNNYQNQHFEIISGNMIMLQQHTMPVQQAQYVNKLQAIAPAQPKVLGNSNLQNIQQTISAPMMVKKKYTYANMPYGEQLPSVARRNARERNRVKQVNNGFANLRQHIPQTVINTLSNGGRGASKKLSKVDTLRIAVEYIRGLQDLLDSTNPNGSSIIIKSHQVNQFDESSNDGSNYAYSSVDSPVDNHVAYQMTHSPTSSSYSDSDLSISGANSFVQPLKLEDNEQDFKFDFSEQHDDEELLDYISSWQDQ